MPAQTLDLPKRLPLVIEPENRSESTEFDAKLVNGYVEMKQQGKEGSETWIYQRPGTEEFQRPSGGNAVGRGCFNWKGNIYSIFGTRLYKDGVDVGGAVTLNATNGVYRFDSCMGATPKLQLGDGVKGYNYDAGGGLVMITDGDFPALFVKGWAFLDGTTYVMTPEAYILGDDINTPTDWDPVNSILAQIEPDAGVGISKQLVYVIAFKDTSTEIFYDAANSTGSPLGRVEGAKVNWGLVHEDGFRDLGGVLVWLGKTKDGSMEVMYMNNLKAEVVSTKAVERLLAAVNFATETVYTWVLSIPGHKFFVVTFKDMNMTLAYDTSERMWSQWTDTNGNYVPIVDSCVDANLRTIVQHESNGRLYYMDETLATDAGELIQVDIYTPNFDGGTRRNKAMNIFDVISDQKIGSTLQVRFNDNDYKSGKWSNFRSIDMNKKRTFLTECGTFSRRITNLRHRCPVRMPRIQAVEMQIDLGTK